MFPAKVLNVLTLNTSESVWSLEYLFGTSESGRPVHAVFDCRKSDPLVISQSADLIPSEFQCAYSFVISPSGPLKLSLKSVLLSLTEKLHTRAEPVTLSTMSP